VGTIYCQDSNPLSMDVDQQDDSDVEVKLYVDAQPKSSNVDREKIVTVSNSTIAQNPEPFACHECTNCNVKSDMTSRVCESGINMCYVSLCLCFISYSLISLCRQYINVLIIQVESYVVVVQH
jgi:hypothetical protein